MTGIFEKTLRFAVAKNQMYLAGDILNMIQVDILQVLLLMFRLGPSSRAQKRLNLYLGRRLIFLFPFHFANGYPSHENFPFFDCPLSAR
jgi:hypothetical protein